MALSAQNQSTSYVNLYYSIVQRAAMRYCKEYYGSGEYFLLHQHHLHINTFFSTINNTLSFMS